MSIDARFKIRRAGFALDVDLQIPDKGVTAIFGPSGCGKTTLLRAIAGLDRYRDGFLKMAGMLWQQPGNFVPVHKRAIGYVFQEASLFSHLDVQQNLHYALKRASTSRTGISLQQAIEMLSIGGLLKRKADTLSGGERQRVAIARALAVNPCLLLMDEPLASLDQASKREVLPFLDSLHTQLDIPVLYVSHSADEVARLADYLVLLEAGRLVASGAIDSMLTSLDFSLAHGDDAESLITATVVAHDDEYALTYLDFSGGRFTVARIDVAVGRSVRLRVAARDVSLTLEQQQGTSILNIFPATVESLAAQGDTQMIVRLRVGEVPLLARITRKSAALLDLQTGRKIYVQVKSVAMLH